MSGKHWSEVSPGTQPIILSYPSTGICFANCQREFPGLKEPKFSRSLAILTFRDRNNISEIRLRQTNQEMDLCPSSWTFSRSLKLDLSGTVENWQTEKECAVLFHLGWHHTNSVFTILVLWDIQAKPLPPTSDKFQVYPQCKTSVPVVTSLPFCIIYQHPPCSKIFYHASGSSSQENIFCSSMKKLEWERLLKAMP